MKRGFTLIELLVVLTIIAIAAALLFAVVGGRGNGEPIILNYERETWRQNEQMLQEQRRANDLRELELQQAQQK